MTTDDKVEKRTVFLSSVFKDDYGKARKYVPLRQRIIETKKSLPVLLWAYEHYWPEGSENVDPDADTIIDRCFSGIKSCDLFVFLLTGRHGSGATYLGDPTFATYLEMELFAAALLKKPILVLHERGHEPETGLKDTLILLNRHFGSSAYIIDGEDGLYRSFLEACGALAQDDLRLDDVKAEARLPEWLSMLRSKSDIHLDISDPALLFLNGNLRADKPKGDLNVARQLLTQVASGVRSTVDGAGTPMPHGAALFRIWAAMRELMGRTDATASDVDSAQLWDRALGLWAGKASWFGLHGHLGMGPLAAVNTQLMLRRVHTSKSGFASAKDVREPVGARASALYSIAKKMVTWRRKLWHFQEVVILATEAAKMDTGAHQGALAIRGHALLQMAQLGQPWKLWAASDDFKESLRLREASHASPASIGEATCDLGLIQVLTFRCNTGLALVQTGVDLLRQDQTVNGMAFLARGLRTLERAAKFAGANALAIRSHEERLALSAQIEALDQARDV